MSLLKANCFIDNSNITEAAAIAASIAAAEAIDNEYVGSDIINKLYYISTKLGKIYVSVSNEDKLILSVTENLILTTDIPNFINDAAKDFILEERNLLNSTTKTLIPLKEALYRLIKIDGITNEEIILENKFGYRTFVNNTELTKYINFSTFTKLVPPADESSNSGYGYSATKINDTNIVVGNSSGKAQKGVIYIYDLNGENKIEIAPADGDRFSRFIAVTNTHIAATNGTNFPLKVRLYNMDGTDTNVILEGPDKFGTGITMNSKYIFVADSDANGDKSNQGIVYMYDFMGTKIRSITSKIPKRWAYMGNIMACNEEVLVIGYEDYTGDEANQGRIEIIDLNSMSSKYIYASDHSHLSKFGVSVALNKDTIAVGTEDKKIYLYNLDGSNERIITSSLSGVYDFGEKVAISDNKIAVSDTLSDNNFIGAVHVFNLDGTNEIKVVNNPRASYESFGAEIDISTGGLLVKGNDDLKYINIYN